MRDIGNNILSHMFEDTIRLLFHPEYVCNKDDDVYRLVRRP